MPSDAGIPSQACATTSGSSRSTGWSPTPPALLSAVLRYVSSGEDALTAALREATPADDRFGDVTARLAAGQILAVQRALGQANQAHIARGVSADDRAPDALAEADHAFGLLRGGLVAYRA
jgi:hypothetical protein